jgi:hypothetical protein
MCGTGGGAPPDLAEMGLSQVYQRTIELISPVSLEGTTSVPDPLEVSMCLFIRLLIFGGQNMFRVNFWERYL